MNEIQKKIKTCDDAIALLREYLEVEYYGVNNLEKSMVHVVHALLISCSIFEDLKARYEHEEEGYYQGLGKIMNLLNTNGYSAICDEIESELKNGN